MEDIYIDTIIKVLRKTTKPPSHNLWLNRNPRTRTSRERKESATAAARTVFCLRLQFCSVWQLVVPPLLVLFSYVIRAPFCKPVDKWLLLRVHLQVQNSRWYSIKRAPEIFKWESVLGQNKLSIQKNITCVFFIRINFKFHFEITGFAFRCLEYFSVTQNKEGAINQSRWKMFRLNHIYFVFCILHFFLRKDTFCNFAQHFRYTVTRVRRTARLYLKLSPPTTGWTELNACR